MIGCQNNTQHAHEIGDGLTVFQPSSIVTANDANEPMKLAIFRPTINPHPGHFLNAGRGITPSNDVELGGVVPRNWLVVLGGYLFSLKRIAS